MRAYARAPTTYGVLPEAAIPQTTSNGLSSIFFKSSTAISLESSAPSIAVVNASLPPAIRPWTRVGSTPYVGGHSDASSTPKRPDVPAPI